MKPYWLLLLSLLSAPALRAHTMGNVDFTCPLGGEKFTTMQDLSGTQFGMQLDMKPLGPTAAPWRLPVCPGNHFVIYKNEKDFTPAEIKRLTPYINSPQYQALTKDNSAYYLLGQILTFEKHPDSAIAFAYLQASWEARTPEQYSRYATASLDYYLKVIAANKQPSVEIKQYQQLLVGELYRRLGQFSTAETYLKALQKSPTFSKGLLGQITSYQLTLIANQDSAPHPIPKEKP